MSKGDKASRTVRAGSAHPEAGTLYVVGTPIGNLEDMTFRAIRILREVEWIAAEDTRQTRKLLSHFDIHTRLVSYHEHNKGASGPELIRLLEEGQSIALVSDAGMPAISDPGVDLVALAVRQGLAVVPVPGANAALSALVISGLPTERFLFVGFPPREKKAAVQWLKGIAGERATLIMYESPHRIGKTLAFMLEVLGDRKMALVRELTKKHEEAIRGTIAECAERFAEQAPLGELCLVVDGVDEAAAADESGHWWRELDVGAHVAHYEATMSRKEAIKQAAIDRGVPKRDIYNEVNRF